MPPVLRALPYFDLPTSVTVAGEAVDIVAHQIVVWVGFAHRGETVPAPNAPRFPAILDTGFSGNVVISPNHLQRWAGVAWNTLPFDPTPRPNRYQGVIVPHRRGNIWIYPNQYGWRDFIDPLLPPSLLALNGGIAVYGDGAQVGAKETARLVGPRLPLIGVRALSTSPLFLQIDTTARQVWLDSA
jgi:hypothetical protein